MDDTSASIETNTIPFGSVDFSDNTLTECKGCCRSFGFIVRKRMCAVCEHIYCGKCTNYRISLPNYPGKYRVCEKCKETILRNASLFMSRTPATLDTEVTRPSTSASTVPLITDTNVVHEQCDNSEPGNSSITLPAVRKPSPLQTLSPDCCKTHIQEQASTQSRQEQHFVTEAATRTREVGAGSCSVDDCSVGSLCSAPESPLLPLRRVFRDPVSGKYLEEKDLKLHDESLVEDLEAYVVYDSDLDRTFEQGGLHCEVSCGHHPGGHVDFRFPDPQSPVAKRSTVIPEKYGPLGVGGGDEGGGVKNPARSSKKNALNGHFERPSADIAEKSTLHYHVTCTSDDLKTRKTTLIDSPSRYSRTGSCTPSRPYRGRHREDNVAEGSTDWGRFSVVPTSDNGIRRSCVSERGGFTWRALAQVYHSVLPSKRPSLRLVLMSMAVIIICNVASLTSGFLPFHSLNHLGHNCPDPLCTSSPCPPVSSSSKMIDAVGESSSEIAVMSDLVKQSRDRATTLRVHIGVRGYETQYAVSNKKSDDEDDMADAVAPRNPHFDVTTNDLSKNWKSSTTVEFVRKQKKVLALALRRVWSIPSLLSHVLVHVIRYLVRKNS